VRVWPGARLVETPFRGAAHSAEPPYSIDVHSSSVDYCVDDAMADHERLGVLPLSGVRRLLDQHRLRGPEISEVFAALRARGVAVVDDTAADRRRPPTALVTEKPMGDAVGMMMRSAGRFPLLDAEEEMQLGRRIALGIALKERGELPPPRSEEARQIRDGRIAHQQLVLANLRLVASIARRYRPPGLELSDLLQEGTIGLMRAAEKFDHTRGLKFSTYATWWVKQGIQRATSDKSRLIRIPVHVDEKLQGVRKVQAGLRARIRREPTLVELAEAVDMEPSELQGLLDVARDVISIDRPIGDDDGADLADVLNLYSADVSEEVERAMELEAVNRVLDDMDRTQQASKRGASAQAIGMLRQRFGFDGDREHTLEEVGDAYGVTRERARQIMNKMLQSRQMRIALAQAIDAH
jgi:RNA polymerase primary sigma factor